MDENVSSDEKSYQFCTKGRLCGLSMCLTTSLAISLGCLGGVSYYLFAYARDIQLCPSFETFESICMESQCIKSSAEISDFVDNETDPCEDFHEFVCKKFMTSAYEKLRSSMLDEEQDQLENKINRFIIEPESKDDLPPVIMQKRYFHACLNKDETDEYEIKDLLNRLQRIGVWPLHIKRRGRQKSLDWIEFMTKAREEGLPFDWFLDVDIYAGENYSLRISKPKLCDRHEEDLSEEYRAMILNILESIDKYPNNILEKIINETVDFQRNILQICSWVKDESVKKGDLLELEDTFNKTIKTKTFLSSITGKKWKLNSEVFYHEDYIVRLLHFLKNTTPGLQANYIALKIIEYFAPYLTSYENYFFDGSSENDVKRYTFCLMDTKLKFNRVSETMYIRSYITDNIRHGGEELVTTIKNELLDEIQNISWIRDETKQKYFDLLNKTEILIGGPDLIFDDKIFERHLHVGKVIFTTSNIIDMIIHWSKATFLSKMGVIGEPSHSELLKFTYRANEASEISTTFKDGGKILVPTIMFYGTFYHTNRPMYLNYGSLGSLIGAKIVEETVFLTKNVDDPEYDNYEKIERCLTPSLSTSSDKRNASVVQANFGDLLGRHLAYNAYQKYVEENGEELPLVNVPYTPNQLFWIKSTMNLCFQQLPNKNTYPHYEEMLKHRAIETVKNSPFFGNDFSCVKNSAMNPARKCNFF